MNDFQSISLRAEDLQEIARYRRLDLSVDFTRYSWVLADEQAAVRAIVAGPRPAAPAALLAFFDQSGIDYRNPSCPKLAFQFSRTADTVAFAVHFDHDQQRASIFVLDAEAMLGRLNSAQHWHSPEVGQLLALVQRFGMRCLPGLLRFASDPSKSLRTSAIVLSRFGVPEVAPIMARAFADPRQRAVAVAWLDEHRDVAGPALASLLQGSLLAVAYLGRSAPLVVDEATAAIVRRPEVAELLAGALGERVRISASSGVYLGERIDVTGASRDPTIRFGAPRQVLGDADASQVERADLRRLFADIGDGFPAGGSIEAFLAENGEETEGFTVRTIEEIESGKRYLAYLHHFGDNLGGYVVRDEGDRAVVAEIGEHGLSYAPRTEDCPWPGALAAE